MIETVELAEELQRSYVRMAVCEDLPRLRALGYMFFSTSKHPGCFDFDHFFAVWTRLIVGGSGAIFLLERDGEIVGALGGVVHPDINTGDQVASEFFWFVNAEHRGRGLALYRAFEAWAKAKDCRRVHMVHLSCSMPEKLKEFYIRSGFVEIETHYSKVLC